MISVASQLTIRLKGSWRPEADNCCGEGGQVAGILRIAQTCTGHHAMRWLYEVGLPDAAGLATEPWKEGQA